MNIVEISTDDDVTHAHITFDVKNSAKDEFRNICKSKGLTMNKVLRHILYEVLRGNIAIKHLIDN